MKRKNGGFTLVELLGVLVIISFLITISTGSVLVILNRSRQKMASEIRNHLGEAALTYVVDHATLAKCSQEFSKEIYEDKNVTNLNLNSTCFRRVTVGELVNSGVFEDNRGVCSNEDIVIVYRYFDGINSEYKTFISEDTCQN